METINFEKTRGSKEGKGNINEEERGKVIERLKQREKEVVSASLSFERISAADLMEVIKFLKEKSLDFKQEIR